MGVQACRLPGVKRLKSLRPLKCLTILQAPQGKSYPKARSMPSCGNAATPQATGTPGPDQWLPMGVQAGRFPAFKCLKRLRSFLARPTPQAKATPRPDQCLLIGVQARRLPGVKPLKSLKPLKCLTEDFTKKLNST